MLTAILPMFPLELVAFPQERLALHIFEDRYKQLIEDCEHNDITFGIPTYINNQLQYGTEMRLLEVSKRYESGACDVICEGLRAFQLKNFEATLFDKLYAGGQVLFLNEKKESNPPLKESFIRLLRAFYAALKMETPFIEDEDMNSFSLAHKIGLSIEQEYELLQITSENKRYQYLIDHLNIVYPALMTINRTKEIIKLNGHFKNFDPLNFEDYKPEFPSE